MKFPGFSKLLIATSFLALQSMSHAQFVGPNAEKSARTVAEILKNPVDDQRVVLRGKILKKIGKDKYIFSDGSAEIRVDIDDYEFPQQPINESTLVEISGKVDQEFMRPLEIDVKRITLVQ